MKKYYVHLYITNFVGADLKKTSVLHVNQKKTPMNATLSKSDFKLAQSCPTKLYYKKNNYAECTEGDEYLQLLADGGYMVGKLAQLLYPEGIEVKTESGTGYAVLETEALLSGNENMTLFEAAISVDNKIIRIDILRKMGNDFHLIEVKSKSMDSRVDEKGKPKKKFTDSEFQEYLEDLAYQKIVLQEKYPKARIFSYLMLPDKKNISNLEGLIGWFDLKRGKPIGTFTPIEVNFTGNQQQIQAIRDTSNKLLELFQVDQYIDPLIPLLKKNAQVYLQSLIENKKIKPELSCNCRGCEYDEGEKNGFRECWGKLAEPNPHILELAQLGNVNKKSNIINELIAKGKTALNDLEVSYVQKEDGTPFYNNRPYYQLTQKKEFLLDGFAEEMTVRNLTYPLHFIDFETSQMALPYHAGMRCYENVIFQWSCHTIPSKGAKPVHREWINTESVYPNFEFAKQLKNCIGDRGSVLIWSLYENTQLKSILRAMEEIKHHDTNLIDWLKRTISYDSKDPGNRMIDLHNWCLRFYFHPLMGGRTSIKVVLPAALASNASPKIEEYLAEMDLLRKDSNSKIINPYDLLPEVLPVFNGQPVQVKDGTGAMKAYQDMHFGLSKNDPKAKEQYKQGLLKYCKLDTLAMVIIWEHWTTLSTR